MTPLQQWQKAGRPLYEEASKALDEAHKACFKHPDRDVLGMSRGPFSGVNVALGIIAKLEQEVLFLRMENKKLKNIEYPPPNPGLVAARISGMKKVESVLKVSDSKESSGD